MSAIIDGLKWSKQIYKFSLTLSHQTLGPLINPSIYMRVHLPVTCSLSATLNNPSFWEEV